MKTVSYNELEKIQYMPLPNGLADCWLRKDIQEEKDEDGNTIYTADEVYFRTAKTEAEIEADFDTIFENGGTGEVFDPDSDTPDTPVTLTLAQRVEDLETLIVDLAEIEVSAGNLELEDIPDNLQGEVRVKLDDSKWKDK